MMDYEGVNVERLNHDSFRIKGSRTIYVDPYEIQPTEDKADILLITHEHNDHCSTADIPKVVGSRTVIVTVADCQSKLSGIEAAAVKLVEPGDKLKIGEILIEAVPAYNLNKFRSPGMPYHPKDNLWVGFIINIDGKRIYHAGDTDVIPEMDSFKDIDVALLPVSGTYVMTALEAVDACRKIKPKLTIPMHYGAIVGTQSDAESFKQRASSICRVEII